MQAEREASEDQQIDEQRRHLVRFLTNKLGNVDDAQELAQDALIRLHALRHAQHIDNKTAYMYQVASNLATDQIRRKALLDRYLEGESLRAEANAEQHTADTPEDLVSAQQLYRRMRQVIDALPFKCRQALMLHRVRGLTYSEIARELDVSVSSVEKYILEALNSFRRNLI